MENLLKKIIRQRRSVFPLQFNGELVSNSTIDEMLYNANTAPTHKMTQPWLFKVFHSDSKLKLANEIIRLKSDHELSDHIKNNINLKFKLSSHIICICMSRDKNNAIPEWEELAATSMSVQNMWLTCTSYNLGCYWSSPALISKLHSFLNLKDNEKCLGLFYIGKYDNLPERKIIRESVNDKVDWI